MEVRSSGFMHRLMNAEPAKALKGVKSLRRNFPVSMNVRMVAALIVEGDNPLIPAYSHSMGIATKNHRRQRDRKSVV